MHARFRARSARALTAGPVCPIDAGSPAAGQGARQDCRASGAARAAWACALASLAPFAAWADEPSAWPGSRACVGLEATTLSPWADKFRDIGRACALDGLGRGEAPTQARAPQPDAPHLSLDLRRAELPGWRAPIGIEPEPSASPPDAGRTTLLPTNSPAARAVALAPLVDATARRHDIDPLLLHAIAYVESRHRSDALSPAGAVGLMQVMPGTAGRFGVRDARHLRHAGTSLEVGAGYLKWLQRRFQNRLPLVVAAYNAGEGAVERYGHRVPPYPETQAYVRRVLLEYERLRAAAAARSAAASSSQGAL